VDYSDLAVGIASPIAALAGVWIGTNGARETNRDANRTARSISRKEQRHESLIDERRALRSAREAAYPAVVAQVQLTTSTLLNEEKKALRISDPIKTAASQKELQESWNDIAIEHDKILAWDSRETLLLWGQVVVYSSDDTERAWGDWIQASNTLQQNVVNLAVKAKKEPPELSASGSTREHDEWLSEVAMMRLKLTQSSKPLLDARIALFASLKRDWNTVDSGS
jgi:hypothetical protein